MSHTVRIEDVERQPLAIVRRRAAGGALKAVIPEACGDVWARARAHGVDRPGRLIALYLDEVINIEVGVEVNQAFAGFEDLPRSETPAGRVAAVTHIGGYDGLPGAHQAIRIWCKQHGHRFAGPSWEIYGHWTDDLTKLRTDLYYLLKPR
jgi:effector-binding domain-containing protein